MTGTAESALRLPQSVIGRLTAAGLDSELQYVLDNAARALQGVQDSTWFVSVRGVVDVLVSLPNVASENACIVSREDSGLFWTQSSRDRYLDRLRSEVGTQSLKQLRLMVYGKSQKQHLMPADDIYFALRKLHEPGTFRTCEVTDLQSAPLLYGASLGVTLLRREHLAIVPIKNGDVSNLICTPTELRVPVDDETHSTERALRALIILDPMVVAQMLHEFDVVWTAPSTAYVE